MNKSLWDRLGFLWFKVHLLELEISNDFKSSWVRVRQWKKFRVGKLEFVFSKKIRVEKVRVGQK